MPYYPILRLAALIILTVTLTLGGMAQGATPTAKPFDPLAKAMELAVGKVKPALVRLHVVTVSYYGGREVKSEGYGSGVIISPQGLLITNHHVAGDAIRISCTLANKEVIEAKLVGTDALSDIAVVQLCPPTPRAFPYAKFGDSSAIQVGDRVFAMGSPLAFSQSVTMGVVSNTELILPETFGSEGLMLDGEDVGSLVRWIGHDAEIFPGNSGGPLVDAQGEIIGINEISIGLSGAIPGNLARDVADQLIAKGKVTRSWLGIAVQPLLKTSPVQNGVLVTDIEYNSPAEKADLQPGDIITRVNDQPVTVRFQEEMPLFNQMIMALPNGKEMPVTVLREGKELTFMIIPCERCEAQGRTREFKAWGVCLQQQTRSTETRKAGVIITSVRTGGPADMAKPALTDDDMILAVQGQPVKTLDELQAITTKLLRENDEPQSVLVSFRRGDEECLTVVKIGPEAMPNRGREISKAWLPIITQVLTKELADALGLAGRTGVRVTQLYPHPAVEKSGLQVGDLIVVLDGTPIDASESQDDDVLPAMIRQYKIGATVELTIIRDGNEKTLALTLPGSPKLPRDMATYRDENYDFAVRDIAFVDRVRRNWAPDQQGVIVETVGEGGWAALGRLHAGDLLYVVNGKAITNAGGFAEVMKGIAQEHPNTIVLQVKRYNQNLYLELQGNWPAN